MTDANITKENGWTRSEKIFFRFLFIYCCVQALPIDWKYYRHLSQIHWSTFSYRDLFYIGRYTPQLFSTYYILTWGMNGLADWLVIAAFALAGSIAWGYYDRRRKSYNELYYLLRVILRYRLAIGIMSYGFIKLFPMQQPYPSLSLLNTSFGAFTDWKIASVSYGVTPSLESYLGTIEILAAILLLNRKSSSIGAAIVIGFTGNVLLSNLGYNGGETIYCLYLLSFSVILLYYDLPRWINLISLGQPTKPHTYIHPAYKGRLKKARLFFKCGFIVAVFSLFIGLSLHMYLNNPYQYPKTQGLAGISGFYNVIEFRLNNVVRPYSETDSSRWQNVVIEKWNTISIRTLQPVKPDLSNTEEIYLKDENRNYESSGSSDREFFTYRADTSNKVIHLSDKNPAHENQSWDLAYRRVGSERIIFAGINRNGDSVLAVLDRIKKIYLLNESFEIPIKRSVFE